MLDLNIYLFPGICGKLTNDSVGMLNLISYKEKSQDSKAISVSGVNFEVAQVAQNI